jgi:uncharacterized protein (DUF433 family)/predicted RNase H-like HicB family nuclease
MHVLILIEPIEGGRFRARAGEPFGLSAEGKTAEEATQHLKTILCERFQTGSSLALLDLGNGSPANLPPLHFEPVPGEDWFFQNMREAIAENRQRENEAGHPSLRVDEGGTIRIGNSRIRLDLVVEQYENGMTPEDMVRAYDTLDLADVHAAIAYYLRHRDEVRAYLKRRKEEAETLRAKLEAERPRISREELLARRQAKEKADAPAGE